MKAQSDSLSSPLGALGVLGGHSRRGFSFVELMFAVVILGIGFILVAAVFPVGLSQAKSTLDESVAASVGRGAAAFLEKVARDGAMPSNVLPTNTSSMPETGNAFFPVQTVVNDRGRVAIEANMIQATDPRYAWVALYRRTNSSKVAQVIVFVTQASNSYTNASTLGGDFYNFGTVPQPLRQLEARRVKVNIVDGTPLDAVTILAAGTPFSDQVAAAAPGAFLVIANDNQAAPNDTGRMNGRIYRLGARTGVNTFNLAPGYEFAPDPDPDGPPVATVPPTGQQTAINGFGPGATPATQTADAYIIGRTRTGPGANDFDGVAQDVAIYTTFIDVK